MLDSGKRAGEQGAVLVEYMMLIGLIAVVAITGARVLGATTSRQFAAAAAGLAGSDPGSAATSAGAGDSSTAGAPDTTPSTTPPTTVPATTTTTVAPAPTTTLPPVATSGAVQLSTPTTTVFYGYWWGSSQLVVADNLGAPLSGARVTLTYRAYTRASNGTYSWVTTTQVITSDSDGSVGLTTGPYKTSGTGEVTQVTVTVSAVTLPSGLRWDGGATSITVNSP